MSNVTKEDILIELNRLSSKLAAHANINQRMDVLLKILTKRQRPADTELPECLPKKRRKSTSQLVADAQAIAAIDNTLSAEDLVAIMNKDYKFKKPLKKDEFLKRVVPLAMLFLLHMEKSTPNHVKNWHQRVQILLNCARINKRTVMMSKTLKLEVKEKFPVLCETRGIFSSKDVTRVIERHDDRSLDSQQARFNHIFEHATATEKTWLVGKTAHTVIDKLQQKSKKAERSTPLSIHLKGSEVFKVKHQGAYKCAMETQQFQQTFGLFPDAFKSLEAGSAGDVELRIDNQLVLIIETNAGTPNVTGNQFSTSMNRLFTKADCAALCSICYFAPNGEMYFVAHLMFPSINVLRNSCKGESDTWTVRYKLEFDDDTGIVTNFKLGKTNKPQVKAAGGKVWKIGEKLPHFKAIFSKWKSATPLDLEDFETTSAEVKKGNKHENIVEKILTQVGGKRFLSGNISGNKVDRFMRFGEIEKTVSSKTISNNHKGNNFNLRFPLWHNHGGLRCVLLTTETSCDILAAVRSDDLHDDWKAPKDAVAAILVFIKQQMLDLDKLGKVTNFNFSAGQYAINTFFVDAEGELLQNRQDALRKLVFGV